MKKEKPNTVRLGIFVTVAFILFTIAVYNIGSRQNLFSPTMIISSIFQNVNGLQPGNNVRYAGIKVGTVDQLIILNDSMLRVDMKLQEEVNKFLKKDAIASIGTDGLVGNMIVNISPGKDNGGKIEDGDIIESYTRIEADDMLNTLGKTTENIALLTLNLLEIAEKINNGQGSVPRLLNDVDMANELGKSIQSLSKTSQNILGLSSQLRANLKEVDEGKGLLGYLLKDTSFRLQINQITQGLDTLIRNRTTPILKNLEQSTLDISAASADLKNQTSLIDFDQGLIGTVLNDSIVVKDLKQTMHNLNEGTDRFNENMEALKHNFLFRKYFKKQEKQKRKELKANSVVLDR